MPTSANINIGKQAKNIATADKLEAYSLVRVIAGIDENGDPVVYEANADTVGALSLNSSSDGGMLEVENPFGTQDMANIIFASLQGYEYQPLYADGACLDPAAELGDGITANGISSGIFERDIRYGTLMLADVAAPHDDEVIHEYEIQSPEERRFSRVQAETQAQFAIQANKIDAKVGKVDGSNEFGWVLEEDGWRVYNENGDILKASDEGLEVTGKIQADEGYIGGENGFVIKASKMYSNGMDSFDESEAPQTVGVYVGTDGIRLGNKFFVDSYGAIRASDLRITGGSINLGTDEGEIADPVTVDGVIFTNWGCPVDSLRLPNITYPNGYDGKFCYTGGAQVNPVYYEQYGRVVTLKPEFLSALGVGSHSNFEVRLSTSASGVDPIYRDDHIYNNWNVVMGKYDDLPNIELPDNYGLEHITYTKDGVSQGTLSSSNYTVTDKIVSFKDSFIRSLDEAVYVFTLTESDLSVDGDLGWEVYVESPPLNVVVPTTITVTAPTLTLSEATGGGIFFTVDPSGNVTATSLTILGGSININNAFRVDVDGNLYANSGFFEGEVYAKNIMYGGDAGFFDGLGLEEGSVWGGELGAIAEGSIGNFNVDDLISTSLAYANTSNDIFTGNDTASWMKCVYLEVQGQDFEPRTIYYKTQTGANASMVVLARMD